MQKSVPFLIGAALMFLLVGWSVKDPTPVEAGEPPQISLLPDFWVVETISGNKNQSLQGISSEGHYTFLPGGHIQGQIGSAPAFRLQFAGTNPASQPTGTNPYSGKGYIYSGNSPRDWQGNLALFRGVEYHFLYPGIDLDWTWEAGGLKSTYHVAPSADPNQIRWRYSGVNNVQLTPEGAIQITLPCADPDSCVLQEQPPVAWQVINGGRKEVSIDYQIDSSGAIGFDLGGYDPGFPLVIDPTIASQLDFPSPGQVQLKKVAVDPSGNLVVAGDIRGGALDSAPGDQEIGIGGLVRFQLDTQTWETIPSNLNTLQVTTLVADPQNGETLYAGTLQEGFYKTVDGGRTWSQNNEGLEKYGYSSNADDYPPIKTLIINPENSEELFLILQTKGLYKSVNSGENWLLLSDSFKLNNIDQLVISRQNPQVLLAGGNSQLLRSEDGGQTWENEPDSALNRCLNHLPDDTLIICRADSIFKSTDLGATWERIYRSPSVIPSHLIVHPDDPMTMGFLSAQTQAARTPQVVLTRDGGTTWLSGDSLPLRINYQYAFDPNTESDMWLTFEFGAGRISEGGSLFETINQGLPSTKLCCQTVSSSGVFFAIAQDDWDSLVLKLTPDGEDILYASYFGGSGDETLTAVATHPDGSVYAAGTTISADFPLQNPYKNDQRHGQTGYLVRLSPIGALTYGTFYNSREPGSIEPEGLVIDSQGRPVLIGSNHFFNIDRSTRLLVTRFRPDGQAIMFERLIGGSENVRGIWTYGRAVALDTNDNIYVVGFTNSKSFPLIRPLQTQFNGGPIATFFGGDGILVQLGESTGEITWSTYLGGNGGDIIEAIGFNPAGNLVVAGITGSGNLPSIENGFQPQQSGGLFALDGNTWISKNEGLPTLDIQSIAVNPENSNNIAIHVRGYGVYYSRDGGKSWNPSTLIEEAPQGVRLWAAGDLMMAADTRTIYLSFDGGQTWDPSSFDNPNIIPPDSVFFLPENPSMLFAGVRGAGIVRSLDGGRTWKEMNFVSRIPSKITQIEAATGDSQVLTATDGTRGYRSLDGGVNWDQIAEPDQLRWITQDPHNPGRIYGLTSFEIYRSTDYGETWEFFQKKSRNEGRFMIDPNEPDVFYLSGGTGGGKQSQDGGNTWRPLPVLNGLVDFYLSPDPSITGFGLVPPTRDGFVSQIDVESNQINWTTYLGKRSDIQVTSLEIDAEGDIYIAGHTNGAFPLVDAWASETGGGQDGFLAKLSGTGDELLFGTLLGDEKADTVADIAILDAGRLFVVGNQWGDLQSDQTVTGKTNLILDATPTPQPTATPVPTSTPTPVPATATATDFPAAKATATTTSADAQEAEEPEEPSGSPANCLGGLLPLILVGVVITSRTNRKTKK